MKDNGLMIQYYNANTPADHSLWNKAKEDAKTLKKLGATAVCFPPAVKCAQGDQDMGYATYDLYDLGEFDQKGSVPTRYGTKEEYLEAVKAMQAEGINVYADISLRSKLGADKIEKLDAGEFNSKSGPQMIGNKKTVGALSGFSFSGRKSKYSKFKWNWTHFQGIDWKQDDFKKRICSLEGIEEAEAEKDFAEYDYILGADIDFYNQEVYDELISWGQWYEKVTGVDGFRFNEVEAIPAWFIKDFISILSDSGKKELFSVGDFWHWNKDYINGYIDGASQQTSMYDVPLHFNFHEASKAKGDYDLSRLLDGTLMLSNPDKAVTFVDNHESQPGGVLESYVRDWFKPLAYAVILLRQQGYPCMFMGDYEGIPAVKQKSKKTIMNKLLKLRKKYAYGAQHDYFDHPDVVGWTREGDQEHQDSGLAVVMSDGTGGTKRMYVGRQFAGEHFADVMGNAKYDIRIDDEGCGEFYVNRDGIAVWIKKGCKL
jgi:alpha-amylase